VLKGDLLQGLLNPFSDEFINASASRQLGLSITFRPKGLECLLNVFQLLVYQVIAEPVS
jgi:hypothetical protein